MQVLAISLLALSCATARAEEAPPEYTRDVELGVHEFGEKNFLEARSHLNRAHALYPNARTFRALGMVEFELKNYAVSVRYLEEALSTSVRPLDAEKRGETEALLARAKGYLGFVRLDLAPETELWVDGDRRELASGAQLVLSLGEHRLEFRAPGRIPQKRVLNIQGGEQTTLRVALVPIASSGQREREREREPAPTATGRSPVYKSPWLWTALGVVVVGAAAGTAVVLARDSGPSVGQVDTGAVPRPLVGPREP